MLRVLGNPKRLCNGLTRRDLLTAGSALGLPASDDDQERHGAAITDLRLVPPLQSPRRPLSHLCDFSSLASYPALRSRSQRASSRRERPRRELHGPPCRVHGPPCTRGSPSPASSRLDVGVGVRFRRPVPVDHGWPEACLESPGQGGRDDGERA